MCKLFGGISLVDNIYGVYICPRENLLCIRPYSLNNIISTLNNLTRDLLINSNMGTDVIKI